MLRVISRPITVPAERIALLNAGLLAILSRKLGSAVSRDFTVPPASAAPPSVGSGGGNWSTGAGSGGARRAVSRS